MTGVAIYELRLGQCKFATTPFDATRHLFCAEPVEYEGCPYCPEHAARCFDRRPDAVKRDHARRAALARAGLKWGGAKQVGPVNLAAVKNRRNQFDADEAAE